MATVVINKLRIEGNSAYLGDPSVRRATQRVSIDACDAPKHFAFHQATNNIGKVRKYNSPNVSHPNSAPSRKQSFLHRVQQANRGLTSYEIPAHPSDYIAAENSIHFLLRGRPINHDFEIIHPADLPHKRVGHFKTSTTEQYRSRHRFRDMTDFYEDAGGHNDGMAIGHNDEFFYLGPDVSSTRNTSRPTRKSHQVLLPHSAPGGLKGHKFTVDRDIKYSSGYENKSVVSESTFVLPDGDDESRREKVDNEYQDSKPVPHPTPIPFKKRHSKSNRNSMNDLPSTKPPDTSLLNQCLHVQQPQSALESETAEEIHRFNKGFRGKPTPTRHLKSVNGNKKSKDINIYNNNKYQFNSVESYVHFNKIYPQVETNATSSMAAKGISNFKSRLGVHFPRMEGFSPHCTDTLLLKMMFEMNKPARSVKSVSKYSDVAVHKDLDEFLMVGTPSLSRSTSVGSSGLGLGARTKSREKLPEN